MKKWSIWALPTRKTQKFHLKLPNSKWQLKLRNLQILSHLLTRVRYSERPLNSLKNLKCQSKFHKKAFLKSRTSLSKNIQIWAKRKTMCTLLMKTNRECLRMWLTARMQWVKLCVASTVTSTCKETNTNSNWPCRCIWISLRTRICLRGVLLKTKMLLDSACLSRVFANSLMKRGKMCQICRHH